MKVTREGVLRVIAENPILKGMNSNGLACIERNRSQWQGLWEDGNPDVDDRELTRIQQAVDWLSLPLNQGGCVIPLKQLDRSRTSYGLKHIFSRDIRKKDDDGYINNGCFILALALAGFQLKCTSSGSPNPCTNVGFSQEALHRMAYTYYEGDHSGAKHQLKDRDKLLEEACRQYTLALTGVFLGESFWQWVCERRARHDPRGDFVRDTRGLRDDRNGEDGWHEACLVRLPFACDSAKDACKVLAKQYYSTGERVQ